MFVIFILLFSISSFSQPYPKPLIQINKLDSKGQIEGSFFGNPKTEYLDETHIAIHGNTAELIIPEEKFVLKTSAPTTILLIGGMKQNSVELFSGDLVAGSYQIELSNIVPESKHYWIEVVQSQKVVAKLAVMLQQSETVVK